MSYRNRSRDNGPKWITAKYRSTCHETGKEIAAGEEALYYPSSKAIYHTDSQTAADWRSQQQADAWNLGDANW